MKILQVTNRFFPSLGGVETHVFEVSKRLVGAGHDVTVITSDFKELTGGDKFIKEEKKGQVSGVKFTRFWSFRLFGIDATTISPFMFLWLTFNVRKFDVVHSHTYGYVVGWLPILIGKIFGIKTVFTPHYSNGAGISPIVKKVFDIFFGSWEFKFATRIIALTKTERRELEKNYTNKNNVIIIPNGISKLSENIIYLSKKKLFEKYDISKNYLNSRLIFSIGRLDKRKGQIYLLEAMNILRDRNVVTVVYGSDWGEYTSLKKYKDENSLHRVFIFKDMTQDDKHNFLEVADLFVLPSLQEAFGIVYLEAMQHGVPCVGTAAGAIKDVILPQYGSLANIADSKNLSDKILEELGKSYNKQKLIDYANSYDWDSVVDRIYNEVYRV